MDPRTQVRESYNRIAAAYLSSRRRDSPDVALLDDLVVRLPPRARVLRTGGLALLCLGAADLPAWTEQYHDAPMYWSHYDAATSLSLVEAAGLSLVWHRWVAEGSGGHLFVLAQRHDA